MSCDVVCFLALLACPGIGTFQHVILQVDQVETSGISHSKDIFKKGSQRTSLERGCKKQSDENMIPVPPLFKCVGVVESKL